MTDLATTKRIKISFALVLLSFFIHIYLASTHYSFKYGAGSGKSLCSINETLNCEAVSISAFSYFLGKPLATWGFVFHLSFLVLFLFLFKEGQTQRTTRFIRTMSLFAFLTSVVMTAISVSQMTTYCLFCIALHVLATLNFLVLCIGQKEALFVNRDDIRSLFRTGESGFRNFLICLLAVPVVTFVADDMWKKNYSTISTYIIQDGLNIWDRSPEYTFSKPLLVKGNPETAKFRIVEFADFMCPHCQHAVHTLNSFMSTNPEISIQFFAFPLDSQCNPAVGSGNGQRCSLAKAVFCSEKQSKGWQAHNWIFEKLGSQEQMDLSLLKETIKLEATPFDTCMSSDEASKAIFENAKLGQDSKVDSTPTIFVNNKKLGFGNTIPVLEALYKKLNL